MYRFAIKRVSCVFWKCIPLSRQMIFFLFRRQQQFFNQRNKDFQNCQSIHRYSFDGLFNPKIFIIQMNLCIHGKCKVKVNRTYLHFIFRKLLVQANILIMVIKVLDMFLQAWSILIQLIDAQKLSVASKNQLSLIMGHN